jgi:hypothetical protein
MESIKQYFRVDRGKIYFLKFIFEAYDGIVSITTVDSGLGIVSLSIPPGCETDVDMVLNELKNDMLIEPYSAKEIEKNNRR